MVCFRRLWPDKVAFRQAIALRAANFLNILCTHQNPKTACYSSLHFAAPFRQRAVLPLPVLHGERVGVRGCFRKDG